MTNSLHFSFSPNKHYCIPLQRLNEGHTSVPKWTGNLDGSDNINFIVCVA